MLSILVSPLAPALADASASFCVVKEFTGVPCPGCGTTRAALALARLDVAHAFVAFPLQSLAWTAFLAGGLIAGAWSWSGRDLPALPPRLPRWIFPVAALLVLANWVYSIATGV